MTQAIDHGVLVSAAENLLVIDRAGYTDQLQNEFYERVREAGISRTTWNDPLAEWQTSDRAKLLSELTGAPLHQCTAAVREAAGDLPTREIGLKVLADFVSQVETQRFASRRTA